MIADAKNGDKVAVRLTNNSTKTVKLKEIKTFGIEGFNLDLTSKSLTFYPFHNIISITKIN